MAVIAPRWKPDAGMDWPALIAIFRIEAFRQPALDVVAPPSDAPAMESLLRREAPDQCQRTNHPWVAPREPRHVMGGQKILESRKSLIDPFRE